MIKSRICKHINLFLSSHQVLLLYSVVNNVFFSHYREQRVVVISKSEYSGHPSLTARTDIQQVVMYCKEKLICGESEFSFEELRAHKYNQRRKHEQWGTAVLFELFLYH